MSKLESGRRRESVIPVLVPSVPRYRSLKKYLKRIDKGRIYSNFGPLNAELIHRLSLFLNVPESCIQTASNATLALEGAIRTCESSKNVWEIPSWTFVATAHSALNAGIRFKFVDVSAETWRAKFSDEARNVVDVLPFGDNLDLHRIPSQVEKIVVDGAASIASLRNCGLVDSPEFGLVISLHATKSLPAGEGSVFITNSESWSRRFRQWTNFGFDMNRVSYFQSTNAKLSEYSAAVALSSLDEFDKVSRRLNQQRETAAKLSRNIGATVHPAMRKGFISPYWIVELNSNFRKASLVEAMNKYGISSRDWWGSGCHRLPLFSHIPDVSLQNTDRLAQTTVGMPFHAFLSAPDFQRIQRALEDSFKFS